MDCNGQHERVERRISLLDTHVTGLDRRVSTVESGLKDEVTRAMTVDTELKALLIDLRNKNPITEFFIENWKFIALWAALTSGQDVTALVSNLKLLGG